MSKAKDTPEPPAPRKIRQRLRVEGGLGGEHYEYRVLAHPAPETLTDWEAVPDETPEHDWRTA